MAFEVEMNKDSQFKFRCPSCENVNILVINNWSYFEPIKIRHRCHMCLKTFNGILKAVIKFGI